MKVGLIADIHLNPYGIFASLGERSARVAHAVLDALAYCRQRCVEEVWVLGDLFHNRQRIPVREFNLIRRALEWAEKQGIRVTLVAGNHDYVTTEGDESVLDALAPVVHRVVWKEPVWCHYVGKNDIGDADVLFAPWGKLTTETMALPDPLWRTHRLILAGHQAIHGAVAACGEYVPREGIDPRGLDDFALVVLGHYHKPQEVTRPTIRYVGSLLQHDFGDVGSARGLWILDTISLHMEFVESGAPKFIVLPAGQGIMKEQVANCYVKMEGVDIAAEERTKATLVGYGALDVTFRRPNVAEDTRRLPVDAATPLRDIMGAYVGAKAGTLNPERLMAVGEAITQEGQG